MSAYGRMDRGRVTTKQWDKIYRMCNKLNIKFEDKNFDDASVFISQHTEEYIKKTSKVNKRRRPLVTSPDASPVISYFV